MYIADSVLLSLFMSSSGKCNTTHTPSRSLSGAVYSDKPRMGALIQNDQKYNLYFDEVVDALMMNKRP